jgi:hypothetical protein
MTTIDVRDRAKSWRAHVEGDDDAEEQVDPAPRGDVELEHPPVADDVELVVDQSHDSPAPRAYPESAPCEAGASTTARA